MGVPLYVQEWMKGFVGFGADDCEAGAAMGLVDGSRFEHGVTIRIADIDRFVADPAHTAQLDGHIECARLGGRIEFTGGVFNMLVDAGDPLTKYIVYRIPFSGPGGAYTMLGHKTLRDDRGIDLWADVTTLAIRIFEGHDFEAHDVPSPAAAAFADKVLVASGVLRIDFWDAVKSARSFESPGATRIQRAVAIKRFCAFYGSQLWDLFARLRPREARANEWTATEAFLSTQKLAPVKWLLAGDLLRRWNRIMRAQLANELDIRDWMAKDVPIDLRHGLVGERPASPRAIGMTRGDPGPEAHAQNSGPSAAAGATRQGPDAETHGEAARVVGATTGEPGSETGVGVRGVGVTESGEPHEAARHVSTSGASVDAAAPGNVIANAARSALPNASKQALASLDGEQADIAAIESAHRADVDRAEHEEIWFDYIADTGDDPVVMQTLAGLLGRRIEASELALGEGVARPTEALEVGPFVFCGGDTAYHVADETTLRLRFVEPFKRALGVDGTIGQKIEVTHERHLFGIPGNHDYYDSLVGFNRMFRRPFHHYQGVLHIPGYELRQEASYVKVLLPGGWQLWGVDLANGLDYRQWRYFGSHIPDKLILAVPTPPITFDRVRVDDDPEDEEAMAYRRLFDVREGEALEFRPKVVADKLARGRCLLHIGGDDHHYARYDSGQNHAVTIVSGGGGAFLHPTETSRGDLTRSATYPDQATSAALSSKLVNPGVVWSAGLVHAAGAVIAAILYCTLPSHWATLGPAWWWLGAVAVFGGSLWGASAINTRVRKARKRLAKARRPKSASAMHNDPVELPDGALESDVRWMNRLIRPVTWGLGLAIAFAAPFVARQIDSAVDPLSSDSVFLVLAAVLVLMLARLARSRGTNAVFGVLNAIACVGLPISLVAAATPIGLAIVATGWLVFALLAGRLYRARQKWPLFALWVAQGAGGVAALWLAATYGDRLISHVHVWSAALAFVAGLLVTTQQFGWYLLASAAFGAHNNEVGAALRTTRYKQWIRFHVKRDELIGYVIGVDRPLTDPTPKLVDVFRVVPKP